MSTSTVANPPFDVERARAVIAEAGHVLEIEPPEEGEEHGTYQAQVGEIPRVAVEWVHSRAEWGVYVDGDGIDGMLASTEAKGYSRMIRDAAYLVDNLNETDDAERKEEAKKKYLIPCTEVHCEFFGIGHEAFVSLAHDESVIHTRPTNSDTNWGVKVNKSSSQTEWTVDLDANPYEMPVSEIDELVAQLLLARADLIAINAPVVES